MAKKKQSAVALDDYDKSIRSSRRERRPRWHMAYNPAQGQEARHLMPALYRRVTGATKP